MIFDFVTSRSGSVAAFPEWYSKVHDCISGGCSYGSSGSCGCTSAPASIFRNISYTAAELLFEYIWGNGYQTTLVYSGTEESMDQAIFQETQTNNLHKASEKIGLDDIIFRTVKDFLDYGCAAISIDKCVFGGIEYLSLEPSGVCEFNLYGKKAVVVERVYKNVAVEQMIKEEQYSFSHELKQNLRLNTQGSTTLTFLYIENGSKVINEALGVKEVPKSVKYLCAVYEPCRFYREQSKEYMPFSVKFYDYMPILYIKREDNPVNCGCGFMAYSSYEDYMRTYLKTKNHVNQNLSPAWVSDPALGLDMQNINRASGAINILKNTLSPQDVFRPPFRKMFDMPNVAGMGMAYEDRLINDIRRIYFLPAIGEQTESLHPVFTRFASQMYKEIIDKIIDVLRNIEVSEGGVKLGNNAFIRYDSKFSDLKGGASVQKIMGILQIVSGNPVLANTISSYLESGSIFRQLLADLHLKPDVIMKSDAEIEQIDAEQRAQAEGAAA